MSNFSFPPPNHQKLYPLPPGSQDFANPTDPDLKYCLHNIYLVNMLLINHNKINNLLVQGGGWAGGDGGETDGRDRRSNASLEPGNFSQGFIYF